MKPPSLDKVTPDSIASFIQKDTSRKQLELRQSVLLARPTNPDTYAEATKIGRITDTPPAFVEADMGQYQDDLAIPDDLSNQIVTDFPDLANWMIEEDNIRLTHDDVPMLTSAVDKVREFAGAIVQTGSSFIGGTGAELVAISEAAADRLPINTASNQLMGMAGKQLTNFSDQIDSLLVDNIKPPEDRRTFVGEVAGALGQIGVQAFLTIKNPAMGVMMMGAQGVESQEIMMQGEAGDESASERLYRQTAGGAITAATEMVSLKVLLGKMPGMDKVLSGLPTKIQNKYVNKFLQIGMGAGAEAVQEVTESVLHDAVAYASDNPDVEFFKEWKNQAAVAGTAGGLFRGLVMAIEGRKARGGAIGQGLNQENQKEKLEKMRDAVQQTKLQERDPEKMRELINQGVDPDETITLDASVVQEFYQSGQDPEAFFALSPSARQQFEQAEQAGTDVSIPLSEFLHAYATTPDNAYDFMSDFIKTDPDVDPALSGWDLQDPEQINAFIQQSTEQAREAFEGRYDQIEEAAMEEKIERQIRDNLMNAEVMGDKVRTAEIAATEAAAMGAYFRTRIAKGGDAAQRVFAERVMNNRLRVEGYAPPPTKNSKTGSVYYDKLRKKAIARNAAKRKAEKAQKQGKLFGGKNAKKVKATATPLINTLVKRGGIDKDSKIAKELSSIGITPKAYPRLYARGVIAGLDNINVTEIEEELGTSGVFSRETDLNGYVDQNELLDRLRDETFGDYIRTDDQMVQEQVEENEQRILDILDEEGVDITNATVEQIEAALDNYYSRDQLEYESAQPGSYYQDVNEYGTSHRPPSPDDGAPLHDLTGEGEVYPDDIYSEKAAQYYGDGEGQLDRETIKIAQSFKDKPEADVKIYRAVPDNLDVDINSGDWISINKNYVQNHGESHLDGKYKIIEKTVKAKEVFINGDSIQEYGYWKDGKDNRVFFQSQQAPDTPEFNEWFNGSKVVDESGAPKVMYHGTNKDFGAFLPFSHFGTAKAANAITDYSVDNIDTGKFKPRTMPVYLAIRNPLRIEDSAIGHTIEDLAIIAEEYDMLRMDEDGNSEIDFILEPSDMIEQAGRLADVMLREGYDGFVYENLVEDAGQDSYIAVDASQVKSVHNQGTFDPMETSILHQDKRASVNFTQRGETMIKLFQGSDMTSLMHEGGHLFLDLDAEIARQPDAPAAFKEEFAATLEWLGVESYEQVQTEQHEKFARGFEAYLFRGEAPSAMLKSVFQRMKFWFTGVYKSIEALNVKVDDQMKAVFDRLIATDAEIEAMRSNPLFEPNQHTLEMLNADQRKRYMKQKEESVREAKDKLFRKAYRQHIRKATKFWKDESAKIRKEVEADLQSQPAYKAVQVLQKGVGFDGQPVMEGMETNIKLDADAVKKAFDLAQPTNPMGEFEIKYLPRGVMQEGGTDPAIVADMFGFNSAIEMLQAMQAVAESPYNKAAANQTENIMIERHGDMLNDGTIEAEALETVMAEDTKAAQIELKALSERTGAEYPTDGDFSKAADAALMGLSVDMAIKPERYNRAALKAAREYGAAMAKKDFEAAAEAKRREIINKHLHKKSRDFKEYTEKTQDRFAKLAKMPPKGDAKKVKIDPDYHQKIWDLLDKYNFAPRMSEAKATRLELLAINQWIQQKENDENASLMMPPELMAAEGKTHYRDLTGEEFKALRDLIVNLETQGRNKRKYIMQGEARDLENLLNELEETAYENNEVLAAPINSVAENRKISKKFSNIINAVDAMNTKVQQMMVQLDGGDNFGLFTRTIYEPMQRAEIEKNVRAREEYLIFNEIMNGFYGQESFGYMAEVIMPRRTTKENVTRESMLSMALLHTGTENTRTKLLDGYAKSRGWDEAYIEEVMSHMTERDWNFVMSVRDYLATFWPETSAIEKKRFGYPPEKQDALPDQVYQTADGKTVTVRGGYMPIKYDGEQDAAAANNILAESFKDITIGRNAKAETKRGSMIEQVKGIKRPIRLDFSVLNEHIGEQVAMITMAETVDNVNKVLRNPKMQQTLQDTLGRNKREMLELWLKDVVAGNAVSAGQANFLKTIRGNYTIGRLGLRPATALLQLSGLAHVMADPEIGAKGMAYGLAKTLSRGSPWAMSEDIRAKSPYMTERRFTLNREIADALGWYTSRADSVKQKSAALMLYPMQQMQEIVDNATWLAAYNSAHKRGLDEADAIRSADLAVSRLQASGLATDLAGIERGTAGTTIQRNEWVKASTMFFSYFNAKYNLVKNANIKFKNKEISGVDLAMSYLLAILVEGLISATIMGQLDWDDDDDGEYSGLEILKGAAGVGLGQGFATIPFARTVAGGWEGFGGETAAEGQLAGLGQFAGSIVGTTEKLLTGETDKINGYSLTRQGLDALNIFVPLPAGMMNQFIRGVERQDKKGDAELMDYLVYRE